MVNFVQLNPGSRYRIEIQILSQGRDIALGTRSRVIFELSL